jgi:putative phosphoribosyl transferase
MERNRGRRVAGGGRSMWILIGRVALEGDLNIPVDARGIVLFAHGSGSSRFNPRQQYVARLLGGAGLATFLIDLLTEREEAADIQGAEYYLNIGMLAQRLIGTTDWLTHNTETRKLAIGFFGASTGVAAALVAAAARPEAVNAIVARSGHPELAGAVLPAVKAPTLLIAGGNDQAVTASNRAALEKLTTEKEMVIIPGATHLFEEPGALEMVAKLAANWFGKYLGNQATDPS